MNKLIHGKSIEKKDILVTSIQNGTMKVTTHNAIKIFFPTPSMKMVYFEAIANSLDAGATRIEIRIKIKSYSNPESLSITISDNGKGFIDHNFQNFSSLLRAEDEQHKGAGRLIFLRYFKNVLITSIYDGNERTFTFNDAFDGESKITSVDGKKNKTTLRFENYLLDKVNEYDYLKPASIRKELLNHFYPTFYAMKLLHQDIRIKIELEVTEPKHDKSFFSDVQEIATLRLPDLETLTFRDDRLDLFGELNLRYSIQEDIADESIITKICVDGRTIPVEIFTDETSPKGYNIIFLLYSELFTGKVDIARQELAMAEAEKRIIKKIFTEKVASILKEKIPKIKEKNEEIHQGLAERYPHLDGFFEKDSIGIINRNKVLEQAQEKFFIAQKEILDSEEITEEQYQKSLEISSRILMEYVLYRNIVIDKLKKIDHTSSEDEIHNIIIPKGKVYRKHAYMNHLYTNNIWLLDDKFMTYSTVLSDKSMKDLISYIKSDEETEGDSKRPDIAIVFSSSPEKSATVDVVIVELKKLDLELSDKETVVSQLRQRARKLLQYFPDKIQRIWFYAIVDFTDEFKVSLLEDGYAPLYSNDTVFYKEQKIIVDLETKKETPAGLYILSFEAFVKDAEGRNAAFLNLLKESIKNSRV